MTNYKLKNSSKTISLTSQNELASGGEGTVYVNGNIAYKIHFPGKCPPLNKLLELQSINIPHVITPIDFLLNKNDLVGYSMKYLSKQDFYPLSLLFTSTFWNNHKLNHKNIQELIENFRKTIKEIHSKNILLIDINEFNFLVNNVFDQVYCIDTNSYQTPSYPATAIMESMRDWLNTKFTELTDWFSFAILTFNLFSGIHPFRGGQYDKFKGSLDEETKYRIINKISVFNKDVRYPKRAVRDFNLIPKNWYDWYYEEFEKGLRSEPPGLFGKTINTVVPTTTIISQKINTKEIFKYDENIIKIWYNSVYRLCLTGNYIYVDSKRYDSKNYKKFILLDELYGVKILNGKLVVEEIKSGQCLTSVANVKDFYIHNNKIFCIIGDNLCNVNIAHNMLLMNPTTKISDFNFNIFENFIIHKLAGTNFLVHINDVGSYQIKLKVPESFNFINGVRVDDNYIGYGSSLGKYFKYKISADSIELFPVKSIGDLKITSKNGVLVEVDSDKIALTIGQKCRILQDEWLEDVSNLTVSGDVYASVGDTVYQISTK